MQAVDGLHSPYSSNPCNAAKFTRALFNARQSEALYEEGIICIEAKNSENFAHFSCSISAWRYLLYYHPSYCLSDK